MRIAVKNLVIDKAAIKNNLKAVKAKAKGIEIIADLTGDAYGLGLLETARLLRDEGISAFAISDPRDAEKLRTNGFTDEKLMMLRSTADSQEIGELIDLNVICTVGSYDAAVAINGIAEARKTVCEVQIKIDTGLGRYGFIATETDKIAAIYKYMPNLAIVGVFSTYSQSWKSEKISRSQYETFKELLDKLTGMGFELGCCHMADSAALFRYEFGKFDAARIGTALAGRVGGGNVAGLIKVGYIEAGVEEVGWFPKGHRVGNTVLKKPTRLAVLSVGYYHGFGVTRRDYEKNFFDMLKARNLRPSIKLNGHKVKIMGGIGMMHTIVDVTNFDCNAGDIAVMDVDPINVKGLPRTYIN
jgi:alanine racemase